jgi:HEAT repeat protein
MRRICSILALTIVLGAGHGRGQDEPSVAGKKLPEWLQLLHSAENPKHRRAAVIALGIIGPKVDGVVPALGKALRKDAEADVRREAAQVLRDMGEAAADATEALAEALKGDKDDGVRATAAAALGRIGREARPGIPALIAALKDKHPGTRSAAADSLGQFGADARDAIPALAQSLDDPANDRFTRAHSAISLTRIGAEADTAVPILTKVLQEKTAGDPADVARFREVIVDSLGHYGPRAGESVPALIHLARESPLNLRRKAVVVLGKVGPDSRSALPVLREILKKETDKTLLCFTVRTLGSLGPDSREAVPELAQRCRNDSPLEVRLAAIEELGRIGPDAREALEILMQSQKDVRPDVREAANTAVKKIQPMP